MSGSFLLEHSFKEMKMNKFWGCLLVAAGISFAFCTHAVASGQKLGYLDVARVISQSSWGKQVSDRLKKGRNFRRTGKLHEEKRHHGC